MQHEQPDEELGDEIENRIEVHPDKARTAEFAIFEKSLMTSVQIEEAGLVSKIVRKQITSAPLNTSLHRGGIAS